ncbi:MAG: hypothetical protein L6R45_29800 [Anaerolineae bacterium]|nr:hypothetical protein [Anaerolineae bacterium]
MATSSEMPPGEAAQLHIAVERLLALRPAVERYNEWANIVAGLMMTAEVAKVEIPGRGEVVLQDGKLSVTVEPGAFLRPFI